MPVYRLTDDLAFPPPEEADRDGLLAVGGDLRPERILLAYSLGIFPWPHEGYPLLWFSPDPRMVLGPQGLHVSRRLRRRIRSEKFRVTLDEGFGAVIRACADTPRKHERGTWINESIVDAYVRLHELGFAHSAEAWSGNLLAGGLYGICLGGAFVGESMFTRVSDASKVAFATLIAQLARWDVNLIDAQVRTEHLVRLGFRARPRSWYLDRLREALRKPTRRGRWRLDPDLEAGPAVPLRPGDL